jgi:hypothetical protein
MSTSHLEARDEEYNNNNSSFLLLLLLLFCFALSGALTVHDMITIARQLPVVT